MKKITIAILFLFSTISLASADVGINIGASASLGVFHADGKETRDHTTGSDEIKKENATGVAGYSSFFIEKTLGPITIGYDYVPDTLGTDTVENTRCDNNTAGKELGNCGTGTLAENKVQIDFNDLTTYYATLNVGDVFFKYGIMEVDVITNENLGTGSTYGNTSLDGTMYGVGYNKTFDNSVFIRGEAMMLDFDSAKMTSDDNTIELNNLEGAMGKISIGKSF